MKKKASVASVASVALIFGYKMGRFAEKSRKRFLKRKEKAKKALKNWQKSMKIHTKKGAFYEKKEGRSAKR